MLNHIKRKVITVTVKTAPSVKHLDMGTEVRLFQQAVVTHKNVCNLLLVFSIENPIKLYRLIFEDDNLWMRDRDVYKCPKIHAYILFIQSTIS